MITIKKLVKTFGDFTALDQVDITIERGQVFGLVGSNGSGKSTLLRLISGVYDCDGGELLIENQPVRDNVGLKSRIFFLSDTPYFIHQSNLVEMADFYKTIYPCFSYERFNYLTTVFPIIPTAKISSMSKGMQRQAALILALASNPDYLLLDEAFDGLDPVIRSVLKKLLITGITDRNMTVIITSHNLRVLEDLCDHVGLLHKGKIIFNDDLDSLKNRLHKVQVVFSEPPTATAFDGMDVVKMEMQGSLYNLIIRGDKEEIMGKLSSMNPVFLEALSPTLEELFIFEMEVAGYDVQNIIG